MAAVLSSSSVSVACPRIVSEATASSRSGSQFSASSALSAWDVSFSGHYFAELKASVQAGNGSGVSRRSQVTMGNKHEGKGVFAPIVVVAKNVIGQKQFNQLRGKGIALHSQVITEFCKSIGADAKQRQGLIRLAKKNGEKLGFLA